MKRKSSGEEGGGGHWLDQSRETTKDVRLII